MNAPNGTELGFRLWFLPEGLPFLFVEFEVYSNRNTFESGSESLFSLRKKNPTTYVDWRMGKEVGKEKDVWIFATVNMNGLQLNLSYFLPRNVFTY